MMFICGNSAWCDRRLQGLQILGRGLAVLAHDQFVSDLLALVQGGEAGLLHRRYMHEDVFRSVVRLNETETLRCVEPFHFARWHEISPSRDSVLDIALNRRRVRCEDGSLLQCSPVARDTASAAPFRLLVEVAGVEPASASPLQSGLHA